MTLLFTLNHVCYREYLIGCLIKANSIFVKHILNMNESDSDLPGLCVLGAGAGEKHSLRLMGTCHKLV